MPTLLCTDEVHDVFYVRHLAERRSAHVNRFFQSALLMLGEDVEGTVNRVMPNCMVTEYATKHVAVFRKT